MENENIPNINKFKVLTFSGFCSGGQIPLMEDIKPILGKQLRIFKIILDFCFDTDTGFLFVSNNQSLTANLYGKVKAWGKLLAPQIHYSTDHYIKFIINNNLVFPSMQLPYGSLDLETNFITDKISSLESKIYLKIYDGITDSFIIPYANLKIFCEVL
ncbi:MAG: hypothetical protein ACOYU5_08465 [Stygiobacter sp.]